MKNKMCYIFKKYLFSDTNSFKNMFIMEIKLNLLDALLNTNFVTNSNNLKLYH